MQMELGVDSWATVLNSLIGGLVNPSRPAILRAAGAETLTAEHRPARRWFEGHTIGLAARIANNFKLFALRSSALSLSAKVLAAGITAGFTTLRMT